MEINVFLSMLLYIAAIVLVIVFIIVGIKLIGILDKADKVFSEFEVKVNITGVKAIIIFYMFCFPASSVDLH